MIMKEGGIQECKINVQKGGAVHILVSGVEQNYTSG